MAQTKRSATTRKSAAKKPAKVVTVPIGEKLLLSPVEVIELTGIKRNKLFTLLARGEIASFKDGGRRFIPRSAILAYSDEKLARARVA